jgi:hypothetical protein
MLVYALAKFCLKLSSRNASVSADPRGPPTHLEREV